VTCWGDDEKGQASPPKDSFTQVSAGAFQTCGVLATGGGIKCWGDLVANPPSGDFTMVSASRSGSHACAVRTSGVATCWGLNSIGQASGDVDGSFTYISAGGTHSCATGADGEVQCWGNDIYGQASPPGR
jgi:alpha-tubulin suppressor-like RCC1 family protein